jgi:hypothetical protein
MYELSIVQPREGASELAAISRGTCCPFLEPAGVNSGPERTVKGF